MTFAEELAKLIQMHGDDDRAVLYLKLDRATELLREYYDGGDYGSVTGAELDEFFTAIDKEKKNG